ncbi:MAG: ABC transporter permease [Verrucomicrobia bacterium]|nr:ABC transporter permease [Verrucomicrobiota bacterium]
MIDELKQQMMRTDVSQNRLTKVLSAATLDVKNALIQYRVWLHLGWMEVKQRYRRSVIGPWWISLSMLIFIVMMGIVFSKLFHQSLEEYIPFFTAGFLFWTFISSSITEAADIFKSNGGFIKQINLPLSLYVFKHLVRQVIYLMHNAVIYLLVCAFFKINPGKVALIAIPGFFLLLLNVYWISFLVGLASARYRDMVPIITSCVQVGFFITPISWMPRLLDQNPAILIYNPLTYFLDIVRSPLLGSVPELSSFIVSGIFAIGGIVISFVIFSMVRARIAYWVD